MPPIVKVVIADPLYLQSKSYGAVDDRKVLQDVSTPGVVSTGDFAVTLTSGRTLSVAAGVAFVDGQNVADQGTYRVRTSGATAITGSAGDGTNPRIDQVILRIMDSTHDSSGSYETRVEIAEGTPTAGATLANRSGAANLATLAENSKSVLLLADILVPAGASTYTGGNIADKRSFATVGIGAGSARLTVTPVGSKPALLLGSTYWYEDVSGTLRTAAKIVADDYVQGAGDGTGEAFRVGDDASISDVNVSNEANLKGIQDTSTGILSFGSGRLTKLGFDGTNHFLTLNDVQLLRVAANVLGLASADSFRLDGSDANTSIFWNRTQQSPKMFADPKIGVAQATATDLFSLGGGAYAGLSISKSRRQAANGVISLAILVWVFPNDGTAPTVTKLHETVRQSGGPDTFSGVGTSGANKQVNVQTSATGSPGTTDWESLIFAIET
jgi:hypothetical protein